MGGKIDSFHGKYRFLSNFYPCELCIEGIQYKTVEHYYQSQKTLDLEERRKIRAASSPGKAKRLGAHAPLRKDWEEVKDSVMMKGLRAKFSKPVFKQMLLSTGDSELVEGNWWGDVYWGIDQRTGRGQNKLGKMLMKLRAEIRKEQEV